MNLEDLTKLKLFESDKVTMTLWSAITAALIIIAVILLVRLIRYLFRKLQKGGRLDAGSSNAFFLIIKYFVWVITFVLVLDTIGINVSILIASTAALLVGVGLGLQQLFNDIACGIIILFERNVKINDVVQLEDGTVGKVISVGLRTSKIRSRDDIALIIPNSKFVNDVIINWTHIEQKSRFHVDVGVAYGSDVPKVKEVLLDCASRHPDVASHPAPFVRFSNFGDSSLDFQLYFWVEHSFLVENIKSDLRFFIDDAFRHKGIQIPFPQMDVHIGQE
ncbi:MAG: mechanosensitive ion channel [Bacteroidales bacterium]|nr:mechanosensitive ion channel [Bacteroidales bacterium]